MGTLWLFLLCLLALAGALVGGLLTALLAFLKKERGWRVSLLLTVVLVCVGGMSGVALLARGVRATREMVAEARQKAQAAQQSRQAQQKRHAQRLATLKSFVDPNVLPTVDPEYWETQGAWDGYRFPTVYPYSIEAADRLDHGSLTTWDDKRAREGGAVTPLVGGITHLNFDRRLLLARTEQGAWTSPEAPPERWVLFDFQTKKSESFASREELEQAAAARGYQGDLDFKSVAEHYEECSP